MPQSAVAPATPLTLPFPLIALKGNAPTRFEVPGRTRKYGFLTMFQTAIGGTFVGVPNTNLQPTLEAKANCVLFTLIPKSIAGFTTDIYNVTVRFRGIFELAAYGGGAPYVAAGFPCRTGSTHFGNDSAWYLQIDNPAMILQLNPADGVGTFAGDLAYVDATAVIPMSGGATIALAADTVNSLQTDVRFHSPELHNINGITFPYPGWFNGQWIQIDVISAVPQ